MTTNSKEWIQYGSAIGMVVSGIILAFLSFFLNDYDIADGVLWYIAQALTYAGAIFGVSIYFKTKLGEFESRTKKDLEEYIDRKEERHEDDNP
jgi:Na+/melibiose symporter-like transporter